MAHEQMTPADAVFLRLETDHEPQHVGSLSLFEGGPLRNDDGWIRIDELRAHVERRLHRVPRLRQRVMEVPFSQGRPVWVDDEHFDIDYHVKFTSLAPPGHRSQLLDMMSRVQAIALDRDRPLWEMWFIDGFHDDRVAVMIKTHHALGDGIANIDLALALIDLEADPPPDDDHPAWEARRATSASGLLARSLVDQAMLPFSIGKAAVGALRNPQPAIDSAANVARTVRDFIVRPDPAPWNRRVGAQRRWVSATVPLDEVRRVREHREVTINDVVLAACSGALRSFLGDHEPGRPRIDADGPPLKAMVPVSIRNDDEHGDTLGNRISLILVDLPVAEPDPIKRLDAVHAQTSELKGSSMVDGAQTILELADGIPQIARPVTSFVSRRIPMNLVVTNIPGPPVSLYLRGARLEETFPYVEVIDNEGLTIAVVSYDDHLFFGITGDRDVLADIGELAEAIEAEFTALADAG